MRRIACLMLGATWVAPAAGADLLAIYRQAQTEDTVYAAARATYAAEQERLPQARAGILPTVNLSGNTEYNDRDLRFRGGGPSGDARYNSNSLNLTATQPLFRMQNWIAYSQAKTQVTQARAAYTVAEQDLMLKVAQAYVDVLLAENTLELATTQKLAFVQQLAQAKRNFEVGTATITDANEAQARYDLARAQEIAAQNDLEIKRENLRQLIGRPPPPLAKLSARFVPTEPTPNRLEAWVEQANDNSPRVSIAHLGLEIATQQVSRMRSGHLPNLDAVVSYTDSAGGSGNQVGALLDTNTKYIGLRLELPIYLGGSVNSRVREAIANQDKARHELENAKRTAALNTRSAFLSAASGVAQVAALQAAVVSSQSSLESSKLGLEVGVRTQVDVLNATQQLTSARRDYIGALYAYLLSVLKLKAAAGVLSEEDLAAVNQWLE